MNDEAAFIAAIAAAPDDEAPHKVFADWLDEHDRPEDAAYHRRWTVEVARSEQWLKDFCDSHDCPDYAVMMQALKTGTVPGENDEPSYGGYFRVEWPSDWDDRYLHFNGYDAHSEIPPEFWDHVSTALGKLIPENKRCESFSCSC